MRNRTGKTQPEHDIAEKLGHDAIANNANNDQQHGGIVVSIAFVSRVDKAHSRAKRPLPRGTADLGWRAC